MRNRKSIFQNADPVVIIIYLLLVIFGWMNIYAATYNIDNPADFSLSMSYTRQMLWIGVSFILIIGIMIIDYSFFEFSSLWIYLLTVILLILVLIIGKETKGAQSWIVIGGSFTIQPSEFAKYGTSLALAKVMSQIDYDFKRWTDKIKALIIIGIPAFLILLQPDTGSTLVFGAFVFVLYREGLPGWILIVGLAAIVLFIASILMNAVQVNVFGYLIAGKYILAFALVALAGLTYWMLRKYKSALTIILTVLLLSVGYTQSVDYIFNHVFKKHQQDRINEMLGLTFDPKGAGYNVYQSKIAIGSGGFSGKGFMEGTQTKYNFVPEQSTDFIFCTVGEEWGFLGSFFVIVLFSALIIRLIFLAERQRSKFARIYGYCVASIFFFHFMVNIGMTIGLAPVIGIPLPFFSYGGSSLWAFTLLLFTFVKLDSERIYMLR
ncbi:MAG: rod shape-determining protein RodA [Bacteroidetes bacterium]|nr:MAG: rod shape-determining protein RodA [Bacteroidota bacterium]